MRARSQKHKAQAAIEYMSIVGIALAFLIPIWLYVTQVQYNANIELSLSYSRMAIDNIVYTANLVYSQGEPAKVPLPVYIPSNVEDIEITENLIHFTIRTTSGTTDMYGSTVANLNGTIPTDEGLYNLYIEAVDSFVQITT